MSRIWRHLYRDIVQEFLDSRRNSPMSSKKSPIPSPKQRSSESAQIVWGFFPHMVSPLPRRNCMRRTAMWLSKSFRLFSWQRHLRLAVFMQSVHVFVIAVWRVLDKSKCLEVCSWRHGLLLQTNFSYKNNAKKSTTLDPLVSGWPYPETLHEAEASQTANGNIDPGGDIQQWPLVLSSSRVQSWTDEDDGTAQITQRDLRDHEILYCQMFNLIYIRTI